MQPEYESNYKALEGGENFFSLGIGGKAKKIFLDRLELFFQEADTTERKQRRRGRFDVV